MAIKETWNTKKTLIKNKQKFSSNKILQSFCVFPNVKLAVFFVFSQVTCT